MKKIDAIIVGASNSGLMAGLELLNKGNNVLLLDEHNNIGETTKSVRCGRFNFERNRNGYYLGDSKRSYRLDNLLLKVGINDDTYLNSLDNFFTVICDNEKYTMPFGLDNFKNKLEEYVPGSKESVEKFYELADECCKAMDYIVENIGKHISLEEFNEQYHEFVRVSAKSVSNVLDDIEMPLKAQEILNACWIYFGSSELELSFAQYAMFLYDAINYGLYVPVNGENDITMLLANAFLERGGEIKLNSNVERIMVEDGKVTGVKLQDDTIYSAPIVICSSLANKVYTELIEPSDVPREAIKSVNAREVGASLFRINLGLNRTVEEIGLDEYSYFIYDSLDSDKVVSSLGEPYNTNEIVTVENVINPDASEKGTCIINISTLVLGSMFDEYIDNTNYREYLEEEATRLINKLESTLHVRIREYIEEINITTPVDYSYLSKEHYGTMFGYKIKGYENLLPRILNYENEIYIDGLYLCGGFSGDAYGYDSDVMSGYIAARVAIDRKEG